MLFEIIDKDVVEGESGKLYINDSYLEGYFVGSKKSDYNNGKIIKLDLEYISTGLWHREKLKHFNTLIYDNLSRQINLDYPHDAPFDYTSPFDVRLINENYTSSDFRLVIYGPCINPAIYINEHQYNINTSVTQGEYITVDSLSKKIFLTTHTGKIFNKFNSRNRDSYIFEKIKPGTSVVAWNGDFSFDITLIEDRSEPRWI